MRVIGWDVETHLIEPGNLTPRLVCMSASGGRDSFDALSKWMGQPLPEDGQLLLGEGDGQLWVRVRGDEWEVLVGRELALDLLVFCLENSDVLVAQNGSYDWGVMCNEHPELLPLLASLMEDGHIADTRVREMLICIANDDFVFDSRIGKKRGGGKKGDEGAGFSLAELVEIHFGVKLGGKKGDDVWRLRYAELDGVPLDQWPDTAIYYAAEDALWARRVYLAQAEPMELSKGEVVKLDGTVVNEVEQTCAAWVLHLMACYGVFTDEPAVDAFEVLVREMVAKAEVAGKQAGFLVVNRCKKCLGTGWASLTLDDLAPPYVPCAHCDGLDHDTCNATGVYGTVKKTGGFKQLVPPKTATSNKRLKALVEEAYGGSPPLTKRPKDASPKWKPGTSTDSDTLAGSGNPLLEAYAEGSFAIKLLNTYLPILRNGVHAAVTSAPNVLVRSGRTSWRKPNMQNPPRKGGFRDCFVPREGMIFASIDYSTVELATLAQCNLLLFGYSKMAEAINAGKDLHILFGLELLKKKGIYLTYEEAVLAYEDEEHELHAEVADARQRAKPVNFGFPGGLGLDAFIEFARTTYGVEFTLNEAADIKRLWLAAWPEMRKYFKLMSDASRTSLDDRFSVRQFGSGRIRGGCSYTSGANTLFQGLAADGAKYALWLLFKACYLDVDSPLYGVRMWNFVHDEVLFEGPPETAHLWAPEAARLMVVAMKMYVPDVYVAAEPALMYRWLKGAKTVYNERKELVPWTPQKKAA